MILSWVFFLAILCWDVLTDYLKWKKNVPIKHTEEALVRICLIAPTTLGVTHNLEISFLPAALVTLFFQFAIWWILFDGFFNILRKKSWFYPGSDDGEGDAILDRFLMKYTEKQIGFIKIGLILLSGFIFVSFI